MASTFNQEVWDDQSLEKSGVDDATPAEESELGSDELNLLKD